MLFDLSIIGSRGSYSLFELQWSKNLSYEFIICCDGNDEPLNWRVSEYVNNVFVGASYAPVGGDSQIEGYSDENDLVERYIIPLIQSRGDHISYVLGFRYNENGVLLIKKNNLKSWQHNLWNGLGGKIKGDESQSKAMVREFFEEAGIQTDEKEWKKVSTLTSQTWDMTIFISSGNLSGHNTNCSEGVLEIHHVIPPDIEKTCDWILRMIFDNSITPNSRLDMKFVETSLQITQPNDLRSTNPA